MGADDVLRVEWVGAGREDCVAELRPVLTANWLWPWHAATVDGCGHGAKPPPAGHLLCVGGEVALAAGKEMEAGQIVVAGVDRSMGGEMSHLQRKSSGVVPAVGLRSAIVRRAGARFPPDGPGSKVRCPADRCGFPQNPGPSPVQAALAQNGLAPPYQSDWCGAGATAGWLVRDADGLPSRHPAGSDRRTGWAMWWHGENAPGPIPGQA